MKISVNKLNFPVSEFGSERRIGIWLQGCSVGCKGCISQETWVRDPSYEMTVADLLAWCRQTTGGQLDGISISGGEPFDQARPLSLLIDALSHWRKSSGSDFDLLCYSGYTLSLLQKRHARLLTKLDALIPEPYIEAKPNEQAWRGSSNQRLVLLSDRGRERYAHYVEAP